MEDLWGGPFGIGFFIVAASVAVSIFFVASSFSVLLLSKANEVRKREPGK